jgi:hypothetical protein
VATVVAGIAPRARGAVDDPHAVVTRAAATSTAAAPKRRRRPRDAREVPDTDPYLSSPALVERREIRLEWHSERRILALKPDNRKRDAHLRTRTVAMSAARGGRCAAWRP